MIDGKSVLAIIPARGGSKRLPNKNILDLAGEPLIIWSIKAGIKSKYIDKVIVSSDSNDILNISQKNGADIIKRPNDLANDKVSSFDAIEHTIANLNKNFDYVTVLQPTSPLRNNIHIDKALELLFKKKANAVISVCESFHNPLWSNVLPKDGSMVKFLDDKIKNLRSQDLPTYYQLNGAIYICRTDKLLEEKTFFIKDNIYAFKMDRESSVDIDEKIDFQLAELMIETENK